MTYHTRLFLRLIPGALTIAIIVYLWLWVFTVLDVIITVLNEGTTP